MKLQYLVLTVVAIAIIAYILFLLAGGHPPHLISG